jgi:hypothetical protein
MAVDLVLRDPHPRLHRVHPDGHVDGSSWHYARLLRRHRSRLGYRGAVPLVDEEAAPDTSDLTPAAEVPIAGCSVGHPEAHERLEV